MHSCHCVYTQRDVHRLCEQSAKKIYRFYNMVESILFFCLPYFNLTLDDYAIMHECALLHRMGSNDGDMSRGEINELLPFEKCWMEFFALLHQLHISSPIFALASNGPHAILRMCQMCFLRCRFPNSHPNCIGFRANSPFFCSSTALICTRCGNHFWIFIYFYLPFSLPLLFFSALHAKSSSLHFQTLRTFSTIGHVFRPYFCHKLHAINNN